MFWKNSNKIKILKMDMKKKIKKIKRKKRKEWKSKRIL